MLRGKGLYHARGKVLYHLTAPKKHNKISILLAKYMLKSRFYQYLEQKERPQRITPSRSVH